MGHLHFLDLVMMAAYAALMLFIGWWYGREEQSSDEYFVAGRGARSWVVGISMIAALFSTISFLGTPGEMVSHGPGMAWGLLHGPISFLVVGFLIIPHIMRFKITSGYELLEARFGLTIRKTASLLFIFVRLLWMSFVLFLCSSAVSIVTQIPLPWVLAIVGIVTTISTVVGGIRAVLMTDVLQFIIHAGSGLSVILYVAYRCGGLQSLFHVDPQAAADLNWPEVKIFSLGAFDRVTIVGMVLTASLWWICTAASDQMMIQRYLCTRDVKTARRSFLHCMIGDACIGLVMWGIGAALLTYFLRFPGDRPDPALRVGDQADKLFPHFIATILPSGLRGVLVAALFADAMQSLSSGISALGTVLVIDFKSIFARNINVKPDDPTDTHTDSPPQDHESIKDTRLARRAKSVGLVIGVIAIALSFVIGFVPGRNFMEMTYRLSGFFIVPLFVLFAMAFFVPFSTPAGAVAAIAVGFGSGVLFSYWKQIIGLFVPTGDFSVILIMPLSLILSLGSGMLISLVSKPRQNAAGFLVVQREVPGSM